MKYKPEPKFEMCFCLEREKFGQETRVLRNESASRGAAGHDFIPVDRIPMTFGDRTDCIDVPGKIRIIVIILWWTLCYWIIFPMRDVSRYIHASIWPQTDFGPQNLKIGLRLAIRKYYFHMLVPSVFCGRWMLLTDFKFLIQHVWDIELPDWCAIRLLQNPKFAL